MFLMIITACACVGAAIWLIDWILYSGEEMNKFKRIQGPKGLPIVGNALDILKSRVKLFYVGRMESTVYKDCYRFLAPNVKIVNVYNPEDIETVISSSKFNEKSILYSFLKPWLGDGLLLSSGLKWHSRRKILTPGFHFNILRHFCKIFEENGSRLVNELEGYTGCHKTNIVPIISAYTLNTICETAMGTKLNEEKSGAGQKYKLYISQIVETLVERFSKVWLINDFIFSLTTFAKRQSEVIKEIKSFPRKVIEDRRQHHNKDEGLYINGDSQKDEGIDMNMKKNMAMLDILLTAEKEGLIDAEGIQEEVDTFMFEGHDTTAMGLIFTLMLIANNKKSQEKIVEECREIFGESDRPAGMSDLKEMKYLECCIKESLRLYPPVPLISRHISEDVKFKNCLVPAGVICHIHIYDLHRRADLFQEPLEFRPERFISEHGTGDSAHPYAYIPFSAGPRNCIGQKFAMLEMKSAISAILRAFELHPVTTPQDVIFTADLVLRPHNPIYVKFLKRK